MFMIPLTTPLKMIYFSFLSFLALNQNKLKEELRALIGKYIFNTQCKIVLVNKFTVGSVFNYKDKLPAGVRASLVYKFSCAQCASTYIGSTGRVLRTRVAEHAGRSYRTGIRLATWHTRRIRPSASMRNV